MVLASVSRVSIQDLRVSAGEALPDAGGAAMPAHPDIGDGDWIAKEMAQ